MENTDIDAVIRRNISVKANMVEEDEKEHGKRKFLNYGHTF
ncbi:3-dehydroquinate synthase family protein [Candidatus Venteria ishoeyi]